MKNIDLVQISSILANVGVIAGIVFLAYEIRQNTEQLMRSEMNATQEQFSSWRQSIMTDGELARIWVDGLEDAASLPEVDRVRFDLTVRDWFWTNWQFWDRARSGAIPSQWEDRTIGTVATRIRDSKSVEDWWNINKAGFDSEFRLAIDDKL